MEKFNFEKPNKPADHEINDRDLPLQEIIPDTDSEKGKYDKIIIDGILSDIKRKKQEDNAEVKKDKKKPN